ncbi:hypothetical protein BB558_001878 [Smittium angustum]|uniref:Peptidase S54 rhomboid domain-containing protein n=1 Tax=Smittium angustum TaxID=133377 RepID=A0A2U1JAD6_SMIAN|nr:hypothetical protein BB558_001878 [Smittium angustum]
MYSSRPLLKTVKPIFSSNYFSSYRSVALNTKQLVKIQNPLKSNIINFPSFQKPSYSISKIIEPKLRITSDKLSLTSFRKQFYSRWEEHSKVDYGARGGWSDGSRGGQYKKTPKFNFNMSPNGIVYAIIGTNLVVFGIWQFAEGRYKSFGDSRLLSFMIKNFTVSVQGLKSGKLWTAITSEFSHANLTHMLVNSIALYSVGSSLALLMGVPRFVGFYLFSCIGASAAHFIYHNYMAPGIYRSRNIPYSQPVSLGSSAWAVAIGFVGYDIMNSFSGSRRIVDSSAHLGGAAAGFGYYWFRLRPYIRRFK